MTGIASRMARLGLWLLPLYGVLLGVSTLTQQPPLDDFEAYARYVTTSEFLLSHLVASILGAAVGILGAVALTTFAVHGSRPRAACRRHDPHGGSERAADRLPRPGQDRVLSTVGPSHGGLTDE